MSKVQRPVQRPRPNARGAHAPQGTSRSPVPDNVTEQPKFTTRSHGVSFSQLVTCSDISGVENDLASSAFIGSTAGAHTTALRKSPVDFGHSSDNLPSSNDAEPREPRVMTTFSLSRGGTSGSNVYSNSLIEYIHHPNGGYSTFFKNPTSETPIEDVVTSCLLQNAPKPFSQFLLKMNENRITHKPSSYSHEESNHIQPSVGNRNHLSSVSQQSGTTIMSSQNGDGINTKIPFNGGPQQRKSIILLDPDKLCVDGKDSRLCVREVVTECDFSYGGKSVSSTPNTEGCPTFRGRYTNDEVYRNHSHSFYGSSSQMTAPYKYGDRPHFNSTSRRLDRMNNAFLGKDCGFISHGSCSSGGVRSPLIMDSNSGRDLQPRFDCGYAVQESTNRTSQALLILNLRIGCESPEVPRIEPCAKLECWIDPKVAHAMYLNRASDSICDALEKQYASVIKLQQYRRCVEETLENAKAALRSTRKRAKGDRVLIHYNGHGMPKAGEYGEIWFTGKSHYFPIPITDLSNEAGSPTLYVFDCHSAGSIVNVWRARNMPGVTEKSNDILLCACDANEFLTVNPALPADLLTSCLVSPLKMALEWFIHYSNRGFLLPEVTPEMIIEKIPGDISNRKTPLGELHLVLMTILDCIAWDTLGKEMYFSIMRKDMTVKVLFRNFFLADRLIREVGCTPVSYPPIPESAHTHRLWDSWDIVIESIASQLPKLLRSEENLKNNQGGPSSPNTLQTSFKLSSCSFFSEQLTALDVAIEVGDLESRAPEELPTLLLCLSQTTYRMRALLLLSRYLETGPAAVHNVLFCGISNLITKLLDNGETLLMMIVVWMQIVRVHPEFALSELARVHGEGTLLKYLQIKGSKFRPITGDESVADPCVVPGHSTNERHQAMKTNGFHNDVELPAFCVIEGLTMDRCRAITCYLLCRMIEWSRCRKQNEIQHQHELLKQGRNSAAYHTTPKTYHFTSSATLTSPASQSQNVSCNPSLSLESCQDESLNRVRDTSLGVVLAGSVPDSATSSGAVVISIWNRHGLTTGAELLDSKDPEVKSWSCLFLAKLMSSLNVAKEYTANEFAKRQNLFFPLLDDYHPAVRASCVTLLGSLIGFRIDLFSSRTSTSDNFPSTESNIFSPSLSTTTASPTTDPSTMIKNTEDQDRRLEVDRTILQFLTVHVGDPSRAVRTEIAVAAANLVHHYYPLVKTARAHNRLPFGTGTFAVPTYIQHASTSPHKNHASSNQTPQKTLQMMYTTCVGVLAELNYFSDRVYQVEKRNIGVTSTLAKAGVGMESGRGYRARYSVDSQQGKEGNTATGVLPTDENEEGSLCYTNPNHVFETGCITGEDTQCLDGVPWVLSNVTDYHLTTIEAMLHDALLILYNMRASCDGGVAHAANRCLEILNGPPEELNGEHGSPMNVTCYLPPLSQRVETEGELSMSSILFKCGSDDIIHSQVNSEADRARECRNNDLMHQVVLDLSLSRVFHSFAEANAVTANEFVSKHNCFSRRDQKTSLSQQTDKYHLFSEPLYSRNESPLHPLNAGHESINNTNISSEERKRPFMSVQHALPIHNHDNIRSVQFRLLEPHFITVECNNRISTVSYKESQNVVLESFVHPGPVEVQQALLVNDLTDYFALLVADSRGIFSLYNALLSGNPTIVSSFNGVVDSDKGLLSPGELQCTYRQQDAMLFYGSNRSDTIQMVSIAQEQVVQSLGISGNATITYISAQRNRAVFAGFSDGIVRYFDDRNKEGRTSLVLSMEVAPYYSRTADDAVVSCGDFGNNSVVVATHKELKVFDLRNYRTPKRSISVLPNISLPTNLTYSNTTGEKGSTCRLGSNDNTYNNYPAYNSSSLNKGHVISSFSFGGYYPMAGMITSEGICDIFNGKGESLLLCGAIVPENHYYNGTPHSLGLCTPPRQQSVGTGRSVVSLANTVIGGVIKGANTHQHSTHTDIDTGGRAGKGRQSVPYSPRHHQHLAVEPDYLCDVGRIVAGSVHVGSGIDASSTNHNITGERHGSTDDHIPALTAAKIRADATPGSVFGARLVVNTNSGARPIRLKYNGCSRLVVMHPMKPMGFFGGEIITMM